MGNEALGVFVIFALLALWEIEQIRRDTTRMRLMMEGDGVTWREACREVRAISRMLEKEITDGRDRRMRDTLRE